jgi:hypothetical protein
MNPATGGFKGAVRSRYFVSHDISSLNDRMPRPKSQGEIGIAA